MLKSALISVTALVGGVGVVNSGVLTESAGAHTVVESVLIETESVGQHAEATLWGIYGSHDVHDCPLNNRETAEYVVAASQADLGPLLDKYGVTDVRDRYHSGLEHTFLWAIETTKPHELEGFAIELGIASWNELTIVPLITFEEGVVPTVAKIHGIE